MNNKRIIVHVDLNSFFATASQQANPFLRGKPVGIVKAKGRTCIIAASVEAKRYGVTTGCRVKDARRLCPQIVLVPAEFDKYEDISYRFIDICKRYSTICEVFSLDECFIDVTDSKKLWGNVFNIAFDIKEKLKLEIGEWMTCSVGISYNRLLAKLASNQIKPDGLFWITADNVLEVLDKSDLMGVCGLGWGLYNHLTKLGIDNFAKLRACSMEFLFKHFGPYWSVHLYNISRGIDNSPLTAYAQIADAKSVGRSYTTHRLLYKRSEIFQIARNLCEEAVSKARQMKLTGRYVDFALRGGKNSFYGHRTLKSYLNDGKMLFEICKKIAKDWDLKNGIIFCGVTLGMLTFDKFLSESLFLEEKYRQRINFTIDKINKRFGNYTVFPAQLLGMPIIMPEVTGFFGDKAYQLKYALREN